MWICFLTHYMDLLPSSKLAREIESTSRWVLHPYEMNFMCINNHAHPVTFSLLYWLEAITGSSDIQGEGITQEYKQQEAGIVVVCHSFYHYLCLEKMSFLLHWWSDTLNQSAASPNLCRLSPHPAMLQQPLLAALSPHAPGCGPWHLCNSTCCVGILLTLLWLLHTIQGRSLLRILFLLHLDSGSLCWVVSLRRYPPHSTWARTSWCGPLKLLSNGRKVILFETNNVGITESSGRRREKRRRLSFWMTSPPSPS